MSDLDFSGDVDPTKHLYPAKFYQEYEVKAEGDHVIASSKGAVGRIKRALGFSKKDPVITKLFIEKGAELARAADALLAKRAEKEWKLDEEMKSELTGLKQELVRFVYNANVLGKVSGEGNAQYRQQVDQKLKDIKDALTEWVTLSFEDGSTLKVDSELLKWNFVHFQAILEGNFNESNEGTVRLRGVSKAAFERLLKFLSSEQLSEGDTESRLDDYFLADQLSLKPYKEAIFDKIKGSSESFKQLIALAPLSILTQPENERLASVKVLLEIIAGENDHEKKDDLTKSLVYLINELHIPFSDLGMDRLLDLLSGASEETKGMIEYFDMGKLKLANVTFGRCMSLLKDCPNIKHLKLVGGQVNNNLLQQLGKLPLTSLNLSDCNITDAGLTYLEGMPLTDLNFSDCNITDAGLAHLRKLSLTSLNLSICGKITDAGLAYLRELSLTSLNLSSCLKITDAGLTHLEGMPVTNLNLSHCNITDAGLAYLKGMPLTDLDLSDCNITDAGLAHLRKLPLTSLNLSICGKITDAGLAYLRELPLTSLNLWMCGDITDGGLTYLRELPLTSLNLSFCHNITDDGLAYLEGMPLTDLGLTSCRKITNAGLARLRAVIPGITIRHSLR